MELWEHFGDDPRTVYGGGVIHPAHTPPAHSMTREEYIAGLPEWLESPEGVASAEAYRAEDIPPAVIPVIVGAQPSPGPGYEWEVMPEPGVSGEGIYDPSGVPGGVMSEVVPASTGGEWDPYSATGFGIGAIIGIGALALAAAFIFGKK